jgi:hypothetical protein
MQRWRRHCTGSWQCTEEELPEVDDAVPMAVVGVVELELQQIAVEAEVEVAAVEGAAEGAGSQSSQDALRPSPPK